MVHSQHSTRQYIRYITRKLQVNLLYLIRISYKLENVQCYRIIRFVRKNPKEKPSLAISLSVFFFLTFRSIKSNVKLLKYNNVPVGPEAPIESLCGAQKLHMLLNKKNNINLQRLANVWNQPEEKNMRWLCSLTEPRHSHLLMNACQEDMLLPDFKQIDLFQ